MLFIYLYNHSIIFIMQLIFYLRKLRQLVLNFLIFNIYSCGTLYMTLFYEDNYIIIIFKNLE